MLIFEPVTNASHTALSFIKPLYEEAFAMYERRRWHALMLLLKATKMKFNVIFANNVNVGFVIYWNIKDWLYVEHFAIEEIHRGKKFGGAVMQQLKTMANGKVILETALPTDEDSIRRIKFYESNGFKTSPRSYEQPPYRAGEAAMRMALMLGSEIGEQQLNELVAMIKMEVYTRFY